MRILITGATGFVGRHFIPFLVQNAPSSEILTINRSITRAEELFPFDNCNHISVDQLSEVYKFEPEIVFHLASFVTSRNDLEAVEHILQTNIVFGVQVLEALKRCKTIKLFVNVGTCAEYRFGPSKIDNAYIYSASKTAYRQFLSYYSTLIGFKYVHIVPYTIYGGEDSQKKIIDYICDSFDSSEPIKMSKGEQILDFIHVDDVSYFFVYLMRIHDQLNSGEILHLGTGKGTSILELSTIMEKKHNKKCNINWGSLPYREMDVMYAVAPIGRLIQLGWKATKIIK